MKRIFTIMASLLVSFGATACSTSRTESAEEQNTQEEMNQDKIIGTDEAIPTVKLNSGYAMPVLGLGTWSLSDKQAEQCTYEAIKMGYRLFDTANYYGTEAGVGRGVRRAIEEGIVTREEIFVTTKITPWNDDDYDSMIEAGNKKIGLGYIDLMLIHQSGPYEKQLYRAIERAVEKGIVKSLGISNYYTPAAFDDLTKGAKLMPAVIQNENHIFYQNGTLQEYVKKYGTIVECWYPLGGRGNTRKNLGNATIKAIAEAHGKTPAQITLRWQVQAGYITIPGSSDEKHILENRSIFDFTLTDDEMARIAALNTGRRYENW